MDFSTYADSMNVKPVDPNPPKPDGDTDIPVNKQGFDVEAFVFIIFFFLNLCCVACWMVPKKK